MPERPDGSATVPKVHVSSIVAGEKVFSAPDDDYQKEVVRGHQDAIAVDMESFGVGRAVHDARNIVTFNPCLIVIRGVSDLIPGAEGVVIEGDNVEQRQKWKTYAAAAAAAFAKALAGRVIAEADERFEMRNAERVSAI